MRILFLEPFMGGSHKAFLKGLMANSEHNIVSLTMPATHWKWRLHGGALAMAEKVKDLEGDFDLIVASSMTHLPAFIALTNPRFATTPKLLYMHENQLTQPAPPGEEKDVAHGYVNYLSALVADKLVFTSRFHFEDFIEELPHFLKRFPDFQNLSSVRDIEAKSEVLHPGINLKAFDAQPDTRRKNKYPVIVWNQKWSHDRNPALFFRTMNRLDDAGLKFDLILAGDNRHDKPEEFEKAWQRYGRRIIHYGYVEDFDVYSKLLHMGDIIVSTARFEFFCTSIMEGVYCGCHPILPNELTYPEIIPQNLHKPLLHAPVFYNNADELFHAMKDLLTGDTKVLPKSSLRSINKNLDWSRMIYKYDQLFESMVG